MAVPASPAHEILSFTLVDIGGTPITLASVLLATAIIVVSIFASRIVAGLIKRLRQRMPGGGPSFYILEKFAGYGIAVIGIMFALSSIGLNLSSIAVFAGALGVGVGLGLQGVVKEFVSGLVLLFDSVVNVGDYIELPDGKVRGIVYEIGARAVRVRTNDNVDVFVPNSRLIEERFINWTLQGETRRIHIPFGVAYGVDKALVRKVVLEAAHGLDFTQADQGGRRTQVWLTGFGDSALNFELVVWPHLDAVKRPSSMQAAYNWVIDDALRAAGIEIPFPQRDLRIRTVLAREGEDAFRAFGFKPRPVADVEGEAALPGENDAAQELSQPVEAPPPHKPE